VNIFLIGSTSDFALNMASELEKTDTVFKFGRANLNYANINQMKTEFEKYPTPDIVIFNQHLGCIESDVLNTKQVELDVMIRRNCFSWAETFYSKIYMYNILKNANTFVFITSSITDVDNKDYGLPHVTYRAIRASEQQLMKSIVLEGKNSYGLCPGGMDDDPEGFARKTAQIIVNENPDRLNGKVNSVMDSMKEIYTDTVDFKEEEICKENIKKIYTTEYILIDDFIDRELVNAKHQDFIDNYPIIELTRDESCSVINSVEHELDQAFTKNWCDSILEKVNSTWDLNCKRVQVCLQKMSGLQTLTTHQDSYDTNIPVRGIIYLDDVFGTHFHDITDDEFSLYEVDYYDKTEIGGMPGQLLLFHAGSGTNWHSAGMYRRNTKDRYIFNLTISNE